jgi:hypothetical protein
VKRITSYLSILTLAVLGVLLALAAVASAQQFTLQLRGDRPFIRLEGTETSGQTWEIRENAGNASIVPVTGTGTLTLGSAGTGFQSLLHGSVSVDPASIAANVCANTDVTVTGLATTDRVFVSAVLAENLAVSGASVSAANTLRIRLCNVTAGAIDGAATTWNYVVIRP